MVRTGHRNRAEFTLSVDVLLRAGRNEAILFFVIIRVEHLPSLLFHSEHLGEERKGRVVLQVTGGNERLPGQGTGDRGVS